MHDSEFALYSGAGDPLRSRDLALPAPHSLENLTSPAAYRADPQLAAAVNVALSLNQPLLVTGEPGTGKTQLAHSVAYELGLGSPLVFQAKTTSTATDLFYRYDAIRHFHDAQLRDDVMSAEAYVTFQALGLAIVISCQPSISNVGVAFEQSLPSISQPRRSVVLIDEIDKAPRDFPNDLLNEIEQMEFTVHETGQHFTADLSYRPIVVITSNSEKSLPDAFLRRCAYHHIPFPDIDRMHEIVESRIGTSGPFTPKMVQAALDHFYDIRQQPLRKRPATAECLSWIHLLQKLHLDMSKLEPGQMEVLAFTYAVLAKTREDLQLLRERVMSNSAS